MKNDLSEPGRRPICARCERPEAACICRWIRPIDNRVDLIILQHPLEAREAKNTASLLRLSLARCTVLIGEQFDPSELGSLQGTALLYPATGDGAPQAVPATVKRLILLDATWRKSRKMLHLNPWLLALPRLALPDPPASLYGALRRAQQAHQLSTLEAGALALQQVDDVDPERYAALLAAFSGFVAQQGAHLYNPAPSIDRRVPRV